MAYQKLDGWGTVFSSKRSEETGAFVWTRERVRIELEVNVQDLIDLMAERVVKSKRGRSALVQGLVKAKLISRKES